MFLFMLRFGYIPRSLYLSGYAVRYPGLVIAGFVTFTLNGSVWRRVIAINHVDEVVISMLFYNGRML